MRFGRVMGTAVASQRYRGLDGVKFLLVQPLDRERQPVGTIEVAADATAQAGPGHLVFMVASREGAQAMPELFVPVDLAITGIVDEVDVELTAASEAPSARWRRGG